MDKLDKQKLLAYFTVRDSECIFSLLGALTRIIFIKFSYDLLTDTAHDILRIIRTSNAFIIAISGLFAYITIEIANLDDSNQFVILTATIIRELIFPFFCGIILTGRSGLFNTAILYQYHSIIQDLRREDNALLSEMAHLMLSGIISIVLNFFIMNFYFYSFIEIYQLLTNETHITYQILYPGDFFNLDLLTTIVVMIIMATGTSLISIYYGLKNEKISDVVTYSVSNQINFLLIMLITLILV